MTAAALAAAGSAASASAAPATPTPLQARSAATGKLTMLAAQPGEVLEAASPRASAGRPEDAGEQYLADHGAAFGLAGSGLRVERKTDLPRSGAAVRYQQLLDGVPVLGGELVVHVNASNEVVAVTGEAAPAGPASMTPAVTAAQARRTALAFVRAGARRAAAGLSATDRGLRIYDNRLFGAPGPDRAVLVREVEVTNGFDVRQLVLVDAQDGRVAWTVQRVTEAKSRTVCDGGNTMSQQIPCTAPVLSEGGSYAGSVSDVERAYTFGGAVYDYFLSRFGRDSLDDYGLPLRSTVRGCDTGYECPMENAFWNGAQMVYGDHYAGADDVVGHEMTHGITENTSGLYYYGQSGAINESLSDIFGEFIDQVTASPDDGSGDRWQLGESLPIGAIRDLANPPSHDQPDSMTSPLYYTGDQDYGGVHENSGVGNKAAYLIAAGGDFGGESISGIGIEKAARIFYLVETAYLTPGSDYATLGAALRQACDELTGSHGITGLDCLAVRKAVQATRMAPREALSAHIELPAYGIRAGTEFTAHGDGSVRDGHAITSYAWSFSDGATSTAANPAHTFTQPGPAYVNLTVTDSAGDTASLARTFVVRRANSAFMDLPGCVTNVLPANDDGSTDLVPLPFTLDFFGQEHDSLYVNNNGNVTFDTPLSTYTPFNLGTTQRPIIAPFFADVDTRSSGSDLVRYGETTYGGRPAFCVNWDGVSGVGYYAFSSDKLNRFQMLLVDRSDLGDGDFDIYFNYDAIQWETGSASGGSGGLGGSPARAGFANGTQAANTTFEIPGSATSGAYLDGAPTALASGSTNSTVAGRFVFPVRNGRPPGTGRIHGRVLSGSPVPSALVQVCRHGTSTCVVTRTSSDGAYSAIGLDEGDYDVKASPTAGDLTHVAGTVSGVHVATGTDVEQDVSLTPLLGGPPAGTAISTIAHLPGGTPILPWTSDVVISTQGCPEGTGHFTMTMGGAVIRQGTLAPVAGQPGHFRGTTPPLIPLIGYVTVQVSVTGCGDAGADTSASFGAYIDPSGRVVTTDGDPVPDAVVTLLRADASSGPFEPVPDGSDVMSPSNRHNPDHTDGDGRFGWDVLAGYYQVTASHPGCRDATVAGQPFATTDVLTIPPPVTDLELRPACDVTASAPSSVAFGEQDVASASAKKVVRLTTAGLGRLKVASATLSGADAADFAISANTCTGALAPGATCDVTVTFAPSAAGARAATLTVAGNAAGGPVTVALSGTGRTPPPSDGGGPQGGGAPQGGGTPGGGGAPQGGGPVGGTGGTSTTTHRPAKHTTKSNPCRGKKGRALRRCKSAQRRKAALAKCKKVKRPAARARCRARARRLH